MGNERDKKSVTEGKVAAVSFLKFSRPSGILTSKLREFTAKLANLARNCAKYSSSFATMSFQHFRLGELAMTQPLPPHLMQHKGTTTNINGAPPDSASHFTSQSTTFPSNQSTNGPTALSPGPSSTTPTKQPYGSGDADDGYTLVFPNIEAFHAWRVQEEENQMVEFVKGDTHGSKAIPPRFREHTKLVCARHSRSGRKKYVKKHPDRVRKVPSRKVSGDPAQVRTYELTPEIKLEGQGCPASIRQG